MKRMTTSSVKHIDSVDPECFCVAATCGDWSVFIKRQCQSKKLLSREMKTWSREVGSNCFLWNSNSLERIDLPNLPNLPNYEAMKYSKCFKCILKAPPTAPECLVFFFFKLVPHVWFCHPWDKKWTGWTYPCEKVEAESLCDAITCDGKIYVYSRMAGLSEFVIGPDDKLELKRYNNARLPMDSLLAKEQLVDCCGELFLIRRKSLTDDIVVFKMDFSQEKLIQVFNFGSHPERSVFLIGDYSVATSAVELGINIRSNTIYFTDNDDNEILYSFSLPDKSLSIWRNHPDSGTLWVVRGEMQPKLRLPDKPTCSQEIIKENKKIHQDHRMVQESLDRGGDDGENTSEGVWMQLPTGVQILIAQRLSTAFDCMNFRAVCKSWRSSILPIQWKPNHMGVPFKYPWFMFPKGEKGMYNFYDPVSNLMHCISIPELEECQIRFSNKGWLLLTKDPASIFFFEPFTRTMIQLPDLDRMDLFHAFCFSDTPTSSNWQICGIGHLHKNLIKVAYLRSGADEQWVSHTIVDQLLPHPSFVNHVFDGENFCYVGKDGNLVVCKFTDSAFEVEYSPSRRLCKSSRMFLICHKNELFTLFRGQGGWISVVKLDRKTHKWVEITSFEEEILYLSQNTSLIVEAADQKTLRNTIQLSMFRDTDDAGTGSNISYSLEGRKYQTYKRAQVYSPLAADLFDTREYLFGAWIQPLVVPQILPAL